MNRVFNYFKDCIKTKLGRRYEPWIRRPYVSLRTIWRTLIRRSVNAFRIFAQGSERFYRWHYEQLSSVIDEPAVGLRNGVGVLIVTGTLNPGGSERQAVLTSLGLIRRGHLPLNFAAMHLRTEFQRFYLPQLKQYGIHVNEIMLPCGSANNSDSMKLPSFIRNLPVVLHDVGNFLRLFEECRPKIAHLWLDEVNVKGGLAAVITGVPRIILSTRSLPPNHFNFYQAYMREGYRWLLKQRGVTIINNSAAGARAYERWLGLRKGRIPVIRNGLDFDEKLLSHFREQRAIYRSRHNIPTTAPLIGTVMRLSEEKRPLLWAEIAARIGKIIPEAHFLVVGDGVLRKELEMRATQPDLVGKLHIVGLEKQALEAMAAMDLFLLSSRGEGLPNVLVEAQALGIPVVTTRVGGAPEALHHKITGWVLSNDRPAHAAAEIVRLLKDRAWLHAAGKAGPEFVKSRFGLERMLDETLQLYESPQLTGSARRRARVTPETAP